MISTIPAVIWSFDSFALYIIAPIVSIVFSIILMSTDFIIPCIANSKVINK